MQRWVVSVIKIVSTILITGALGLEVWHLFLAANNSDFPQSLIPVLWFGRFAVIAHFIEGMIAASIAPSRQKPILRYATYTFFVGTVGLLELLDREHMPGFLKKGQG